MQLDKYSEILSKVLRRFTPEINITDEKIIVKMEGKEFSQDVIDFNGICERLERYEKDNCALYSSEFYEVMVERQMPINRLADNTPPLNDTDNNVIYELSNPSIEYLYYYLDSLEVRDLSFIRDLRISNSYRNFQLLEDENSRLIDLLCSLFRYSITIKIKSIGKTKKNYESFLDSFRFQLAYNHNVVIMAFESFDEALVNRTSRWRRDTSFDNLVAPRRAYNSELTNQYYMAVSTNIPFIQFISYYHIMEYFFEKVYNDDLLHTLQDKLSNPHFSLKRENDLKDIVKLITKKVKDRNDRYDINELEALELVLKKFVTIEELYNSISEYDNRLCDYYNQTEVPFSKGDTIDLNDSTNPKLYKKIAARIYKTRNAIIHSKSSDRAVYSPFKDDNSLSKEIPLVRFIAEEIIIKNFDIM